MNDLKRSLSVDDIMNMDVSMVSHYRNSIENYLSQVYTDEEKDLIRQSRDIHNSPYHFRLNPAYYEQGKEEEAMLREMELTHIVQKAQEIQMNAFNSMPPNMKETFKSFSMIKQKKHGRTT